MESSGHYWMPLASHLAAGTCRWLWSTRSPRSTLPGAAWAGRSPIRPMPGASPRWACVSSLPIRDPLAGVELRQAARFAMTLVTEQARVCQRLHRLVELGFPELRRAVRRPHLPDRPRGAPARAHRARGDAPTRRPPSRTRTRVPAIGGSARPKAERLQAAAADSIAVPELEAEVAFEVGLLLDQFDLLERQIEAADRHVACAPRRRAGPPAADHPGRRPGDRGDAHRRDRRHRRFTDFDQLLAYAGVHPAERSSGRKGAEPRDRPGTCPRPATATCAPRPTGWPSSASSTTRSSPPTTPASARPARAR